MTIEGVPHPSLKEETGSLDHKTFPNIDLLAEGLKNTHQDPECDLHSNIKI